MLISGGPETRWNNWIPIKINILIWRIRLLSIPTRDLLSHRGIMVDRITYPICSHNVETIDHISAGCAPLIVLWSRIAVWWGLHVPTQFFVESLILCSDFIYLRPGQRKAFDGVILTCFWCIWNFRNSSIFGEDTPRKSLIFDDVVYMYFFGFLIGVLKPKLAVILGFIILFMLQL